MDRRKLRMKLPHNETDPNKVYTFVDPDVFSEWYWDNRYKMLNGDMTKEDVSILASVALDYLELTTYSLGQECCVKKLRDIWRARRARGSTG